MSIDGKFDTPFRIAEVSPVAIRHILSHCRGINHGRHACSRIITQSADNG